MSDIICQLNKTIKAVTPVVKNKEISRCVKSCANQTDVFVKTVCQKNELALVDEHITRFQKIVDAVKQIALKQNLDKANIASQAADVSKPAQGICEKIISDPFFPSLEEKSISAGYDYLSACCSGVSKKQQKKNIYSLVNQLKEGKTKIEDLTDEQILDIWSWRLYDMPLDNHLDIREKFIKRFDKLCNEHKIKFNPNEVLIRTVPAEHPSNVSKFSIGKPDKELGFWPAAAARVKIDEGEIIPENVLFRIKDDKLKCLMQNPEKTLTDSTVYIIKPGKNIETKGFDWSQTGVVNQKVAGADTCNGFGSCRFIKEVDEKGLSTEVNFSSDCKFNLIKGEEIKTIPVELENGMSFNVQVLPIELSD